MDRDGDGEMEERRSIRDSSRKLKKYGSTSRHVTRNEQHLVKHKVNKADTLQGIALKYGVTTEQIRRINRLWASDSLFLREHLLVPVPAETATSLGNVDSPGSSIDTSTALLNAFAAATPVTSPDIDSVAGDGGESDSIDDGTSITNFLAKMDSSIASVKNQVKRVQRSSEFCYDNNENDRGYYDRDDEVTTRVQRRNKPTARLRNSHPITSSSTAILHEATSPSEQSLRPLSANDAPHGQLPTAVVMTQGRRVKTSLQKLQQQQDEIFQL